MTLLQNEPDIINIEKIKDLNIEIPNFQRPYTWSENSANTLFNDTYSAFKNKLEEYRLGTLIFHFNEDNKKYNIVDGQQRLTTIALILFCLGEDNYNLLRLEYNSLSQHNLLTNYYLLLKRINNLNDEEKKSYLNYLLNKCTFIKIAVNKEQEAFQFFDSQNSRGKELAPHDLLKSYHLREMNDMDEDLKIKIINKWENIKQNELIKLFEDYLFPIIQWIKGKNGLFYSSDKIDTFKGISRNNTFNYALYHKASNIFTEQYNNSGNKELLNSTKLNQFQLNQPIMAGKRFFMFCLHYKNLLDKIRSKIKSHFDDKYIPDKLLGEVYTKQLFECVLLLFADRFGIESLNNDYVIKLAYTWCYKLRLTLMSVYKKSINKYALGNNKNNEINIFNYISEMKKPEDFNLIIIQKFDRVNNNYSDIYDKICEYNGWENNE